MGNMGMALTEMADKYERMDRQKAAKDHTLAQLRQATWEATQFLSDDEVQEYVASVLHEVKTDEP